MAAPRVFIVGGGFAGLAAAKALTFGIVGGGPTGVELAGAIKEIAGQTIPKDYRHIDTRTTRVILFEGGPRLLPTFPPELSTRAQRDLERMGVQVRLNSLVTEVWPCRSRSRARRAADGPVRGGDHRREVTSGASAADRKPFVYRDKGSMAVIGKARAVAQIGRFKFGGFVAWLVWGGIHIAFLIGFRNRMQVLLSWFWNWLLNARDARLITGDARLELARVRAREFVQDDTPAAVTRTDET